MKYIDADKLKAEIERLKGLLIRGACAAPIEMESNCKDEAYNEVLSFISYLQQEQPNNMIQWTGDNLKEVIDFTGKSLRFGEWFKSFEEYENYVHAHNDILKLFSEDGSHFEVPVGAWIVKTPDGYNVPSVAKYIPQEQSGCIYGRTLEERKKYCKFCSAICEARIEQEQPDFDDVDPKHLVHTHYHKVRDTKTGRVFFAEYSSEAAEWYEKGNGRPYSSAYVEIVQEQPEVDLEKEINSYCGTRDIRPVPDFMDAVARHFYELGMLNTRKSIWHNVAEEGPTNKGSEVIVACRNKNKEDGIWLYDLIQCWEGEWEPRVNWETPVKWAYVRDLDNARKEE